MVGRPGAGLLPIRGHSNVQGMGSMGVTPKLKQLVLERLQSHFGVQLPTEAGLDTMGCIEAAAAGQLKFGFCLGGNLYGSNPDAAFAAKALQNLEMIVYLNTTLNTGHAHGLAKETIILPVLARDEEPQATTQESMFSYVRLSDGGPARHAGPRSEVEIIAELGRRLLGKTGPIDWDTLAQTREIRSLIGRILPGWEQISRIDQTKQEFRIAGRRLAEPRFATASGRAQMHLHELPIRRGDEQAQLRLMTVRSEGQFNTVVYEEYDLYRGQDRRDVILMHQSDLERLGLRPDMRVVVRSEVGAVNNVLARSFDKIKPGNALMYYPEANVLVPRHVDPASRTPAFKHVLVTVMPAALGPGGKAVLLGQDTVPKSSPAGELSTRDSMRAC
jgi:anaerobic selenocysteine-containing dehydrogenase